MMATITAMYVVLNRPDRHVKSYTNVHSVDYENKGISQGYLKSSVTAYSYSYPSIVVNGITYVRF
jgi:hypothetical protein